MSVESEVFRFELDFAGTLQCIPMIVRFKLDLCGIKLSLKQWNRLDLTERQQLILRRCDDAGDIARYRNYLVMLINVRTGQQATELPAPATTEWEASERIPDAVSGRMALLGLPAPELQTWAGLSPLQRFTLLKLTRSSHDNENFEPALREFGVLDEPAGQARVVSQFEICRR